MGKSLPYKYIPEGTLEGKYIPLNIAFADIKDVEAAGVTPEEAIRSIASQFDDPVGINIFDMDCVTTTSDGIMVDCAIRYMGAGDHGIVNPDFGILAMANMPYSEELVKEEPHLKQWQALYPGRSLYRGPDPKTKIIPIHNVVITGRAANNNSATEMMNIVTMEEILLPILGQRSIMNKVPVLLGMTGEVMSVGIGMTIKEKFGRVFPHRQFGAGDTAHNSGEYAQTLKRDIPCIVAQKSVLAKYILDALSVGCVPGGDIGCSPAVLSIARATGARIALDNITDAAWAELNSIGITRKWLEAPCESLTREQAIEQADNIIPGVNQPTVVPENELCVYREVEL